MALEFWRPRYLAPLESRIIEPRCFESWFPADLEQPHHGPLQEHTTLVWDQVHHLAFLKKKVPF
jgi:hypothetical protein